MKITVEVPDATCARCGKTEPVQAQMLRLTPGGRHLGEFCATDDTGRVWTVPAAERPRGWTAGPSGGADIGRGLCVECTAALHSAMTAFMGEGESEAPTPAPELPGTQKVQPAPIRYIERPTASAIPIAAPVGPRREGVSNIVRAQPTTVRSSPPPANARSTVSTSMAVSTSRVSSNVVPAAKAAPQVVSNMAQRGLAQVAPSAAAPVKAELPTQAAPAVEVGEADPIPAPHVGELVRVISRS